MELYNKYGKLGGRSRSLAYNVTIDKDDIAPFVFPNDVPNVTIRVTTAKHKAGGGVKGQLVVFKREGTSSFLPGEIYIDLSPITNRVDRITKSFDNVFDSGTIDKSIESFILELKSFRRNYLDMMSGIEGTIKHELTHLLQFASSVKPGMSKKSVRSPVTTTGTTIDNDDYWNDPKEYKPWIVSTLEIFFKDLRNSQKGFSPGSGGSNSTNGILYRVVRFSDFFNSLKRVDIDRWEQAVKDLTIAIQKDRRFSGKQFDDTKLGSSGK